MSKLAQKVAHVRKQYNCWESIPAADRAWITMYARQEEKDPIMVHAGIKAYFTRKNRNALVQRFLTEFASI
jgi:hypothetical protein